MVDVKFTDGATCILLCHLGDGCDVEMVEMCVMEVWGA